VVLQVRPLSVTGLVVAGAGLDVDLEVARWEVPQP
jgi:hypothetical protein